MQKSKFPCLMARILSPVSMGLILLAGHVQADTLVVKPEQLKLSAAKPVTGLMLSNTATEERTVHMKVHAWQQFGGQDQLIPSDKLIVHPETVRLKPGESTQVKVGLKLSGPRWEEQAFQVEFTEVPRIPDLGSTSDWSADSRRLGRSSVQVFLVPPGAANPRIAWEVVRSPEGVLMLKASNSGRGHVKLNSARLAGPEGQSLEMRNLSAVILPGGSRSWKLMEEASGGRWELTADTNAGPMQAELEFEPGLPALRTLSLAD